MEDVDYFEQMEAHLRFDLEMEVLDLESCLVESPPRPQLYIPDAAARKPHLGPVLSVRQELAKARRISTHRPSTKVRRKSSFQPSSHGHRRSRRLAAAASISRIDKNQCNSGGESKDDLSSMNAQGGAAKSEKGGGLVDSMDVVDDTAEVAVKRPGESIRDDKSRKVMRAEAEACNQLEEERKGEVVAMSSERKRSREMGVTQVEEAKRLPELETGLSCPGDDRTGMVMEDLAGSGQQSGDVVGRGTSLAAQDKQREGILVGVLSCPGDEEQGREQGRDVVEDLPAEKEMDAGSKAKLPVEVEVEKLEGTSSERELGDEEQSRQLVVEDMEAKEHPAVEGTSLDRELGDEEQSEKLVVEDMEAKEHPAVEGTSPEREPGDEEQSEKLVVEDMEAKEHPAVRWTSLETELGDEEQSEKLVVEDMEHPTVRWTSLERELGDEEQSKKLVVEDMEAKEHPAVEGTSSEREPGDEEQSRKLVVEDMEAKEHPAVEGTSSEREPGDEEQSRKLVVEDMEAKEHRAVEGTASERELGDEDRKPVVEDIEAKEHPAVSSEIKLGDEKQSRPSRRGKRKSSQKEDFQTDTPDDQVSIVPEECISRRRGRRKGDKKLVSDNEKTEKKQTEMEVLRVSSMEETKSEVGARIEDTVSREESNQRSGRRPNLRSSGSTPAPQNNQTRSIRGTRIQRKRGVPIEM